MKNKKNTIMLVVIVISLVILTWDKSYSYEMKDNIPEEKEIERKEFGIYLEKSQGSPKNDNDYKEATEFPKQGYLLNTNKTKCYEYGTNKEVTNAVTQSLTKGVIDGSIVVESTKSIYCNIYFDKDDTLPTISTFTITGKDSKGAPLTNGYTYDTNVTYKIDWQDNDVVQYCLSNNTSCTDWIELDETQKTNKTITIENNICTNNGDGLKEIYVYLKDKANNISEVKKENIIVDTTVPKIDSFTLAGTSESPFTVIEGYTHTTAVNYNATITENNIDSYCVGEGNCTYNTLSSKTVSGNLIIEETEGSHTVTINVRDKAGNIGSTTQTITLDLQNPTATIEEKDKTTNSITVIIGYTGNDISGIIQRQCKISNQNTWTDAEEDGSCTISSLDDGTTLQEGTEYTIEGRVRDDSGRYSKSPYPSVSVTTDKKGITGKDLYSSLNGSNIVIDCNGMKRYYGTKEQVNNWVCFGYNDATTDCSGETSDYMYRIIGITSNGEIKLIKNKALASTYQWHRDWTSNRPWDQSNLYKNINGTIFLTNLLSDWQDKIMKYTWPQGDITSGNKTASALCSEESNFQMINAKIGLMSLSDYYYAYNGANSNCSSSCSTNWMFIKNNENTDPNSYEYEWTIQNYGYDSVIDAYCAWTVTYEGYAYSYMSYNGGFLVRPVFYLSPETLISSSSGTSTDPFIIAK